MTRQNLTADEYLQRGRFAVQSGNLDAAISAYTQVISLAPDSDFASVGYNNRGLTYLQRGDDDRALADFNKAIELKSDNPVPRYYRGIMYLRLEEWDKAREDFITARDTELNIIDVFHYDYESVNAFEIRYGVQLPEDIAAMLTPSS